MNFISLREHASEMFSILVHKHYGRRMILFTGAVERIQIVSTILHKYDTGMRPQEPKGVADQVAHKLSLNRIVDLVSCVLFIRKVKLC